jgi:DNA/RNA endonuclease G (NUC1)
VAGAFSRSQIRPDLLRPILATLLLCLAAAIAGGRASAAIGAASQMQLGNPSGATADPNNHLHYLIQRSVEAIDYNDALGQPNWVSWDLTAGDVGTNSRASFITDTTLPAGFTRVTPDDYTNSGYDRGHMCASKDRTDTRADNDLVFYMSNIIPQRPVNNSGVWGAFEAYCRTQAQTNEVLVICGPSGFGGARVNGSGPYIAGYTWKIAVVIPPGTGAATNRITTSTRVIALRIPNTDDATNKWPYYVTSATQIEVDTNLKFFSALPDPIASVLRNKVDGQSNPPPVIFGFMPTNGAANTDVVITGTNFEAALNVTFNGVGAAFTVDSGTQITATVPADAATGQISVTTASGTAVSVGRFAVADGGVYTGILAGWDVSGQTDYGPSPLSPETNAPNVTVVGLARGASVGTSGVGVARGWGGTGFTNVSAAAAVAANRFATFGLSAKTGYKVSFRSVSRFDYRRSAAGAGSGVLQYRVGAGAFTDITNLAFTVSSAGGASVGPIDVAGIAELQEVGAGTNVTFRIVSYGGTSASGTWYVYDVANSPAPDLAVQGVVSPVVTLTPLQAWRLRWFGTTSNAGIAADDYAGAGDGIPNLLKYALGLNPLTPTSSPVIADLSTGYLRLTVRRNPDATDLIFGAELSDDLANWTTDDVIVDQSTPLLFRVHDGRPVTADEHRFVRLKISISSP